MVGREIVPIVPIRRNGMRFGVLPSGPSCESPRTNTHSRNAQYPLQNQRLTPVVLQPSSWQTGHCAARKQCIAHPVFQWRCGATAQCTGLRRTIFRNCLSTSDLSCRRRRFRSGATDDCDDEAQ